MEEAVKVALIRKPSIHAFAYSVKDFERQRKATLSTFLPNVTLSESFHTTGNASKIKDSFGVSVSQTIFDLARRDYYRLYSSLVSLAKHKKASHEDTIRLATETAYLNSWLLQQKLFSVILQYISAKETFKASKNSYKQNLLNKNDWLKAKESFAAQLAIVNSYKDEIAQAEKDLEYYTGIELKLLPNKKAVTPTKLTWNHDQKIKINSFDYYYKKALRNRKDLKEKQDTIDSEAHKSQYYTKQYIPSVSLFGSLSRNTLRQGRVSHIKDAGVRISWNVFDGLSNYFNKSAADARKMQAILEKNDLIAQIKLEIQKAYTTLQKELRNLVAQKVSYKRSKNEFILKKEEFGTGLISKVDFHEAKFSYESAHHSLKTQTSVTALKKQELLFASGYGAGITLHKGATSY
jgi:outer membrane protein TolC